MSQFENMDPSQILKGKVNSQQKNEQVKNSITSLMQINLQNIYTVCSKMCIQNFKKNNLIDEEKKCLSKCFDRKNESFNWSMNDIGKYQESYAKKAEKQNSAFQL